MQARLMLAASTRNTAPVHGIAGITASATARRPRGVAAGKGVRLNRKTLDRQQRHTAHAAIRQRRGTFERPRRTRLDDAERPERANSALTTIVQ